MSRDVDRLFVQLAEIVEARSRDEWRQRAACRGRPVSMFFPSRGDRRPASAAKRICAACPVSAECLEAHLFERSGVYGGLTEKERRMARRVA